MAARISALKVSAVCPFLQTVIKRKGVRADFLALGFLDHSNQIRRKVVAIVNIPCLVQIAVGRQGLVFALGLRFRQVLLQLGSVPEIEKTQYSPGRVNVITCEQLKNLLNCMSFAIKIFALLLNGSLVPKPPVQLEIE